MKKIKIISTEFYSGFGDNDIDVDSRMYDENDKPIIGLDGVNEPYHLGQISSSFSWAEYDIKNHFKKELNKLFPKENGNFDFEFTQIKL